ncbi:MAG: hypothetical protein HQM08_10350 [Candidatus Riflebacteria bacterium]|nr:hypothetical protein [Candidatus Riflebacteria bacterium]
MNVMKNNSYFSKLWLFLLMFGGLFYWRDLKPSTILLLLALIPFSIAEQKKWGLTYFVPERFGPMLLILWVIQVSKSFEFFQDWLGIYFLLWIGWLLILNSASIGKMAKGFSTFEKSLAASGIFIYSFFWLFKIVAPLHSLVDADKLFADWLVFQRCFLSFFGCFLLKCFAFLEDCEKFTIKAQ